MGQRYIVFKLLGFQSLRSNFAIHYIVTEVESLWFIVANLKASRVELKISRFRSKLSTNYVSQTILIEVKRMSLAVKLFLVILQLVI